MHKYNYSKIGVDTSKKETVQYGISTNEMVQYFDSTLLHYYPIKFVVNVHVQDPEQSLINDNFTVVSILKSTFKE